MSDSTKPLFDLDALAPRDYVALDGVRYPIAPIDTFGLRKRSAMFGLAKRIEELEAKGEGASDDDEREYEQRVRELAAVILPTAPAAKLAKVSLGQLIALDTAFFVWLQQTSPLPAALGRILQTTERPSPGSPASTAAANGSSKRRSRS